jgi:hypothetical protein
LFPKGAFGDEASLFAVMSLLLEVTLLHISCSCNVMKALIWKDNRIFKGTC